MTNAPNLPEPGSLAAPGYWLDETGGELQPAILRLLAANPLSVRDLVLIRAYLRQWIDSPAWDMNPHSGDDERNALGELRVRVRHIHTVEDIRDWLHRALSIGIDPL